MNRLGLKPNFIAADLRKRNAAIIRWNLILWPLGLAALAVWALGEIAR